MKIRNLDHLNLSVRNFAESADWYRRVFGFEIVEQKEMDGLPWGVLQCGDAMLCIYEHPEREFLDRFQLRDRNLHGLAHFALRIDDEQAWLDLMQREDITPNYDGRIDWPHSSSWYINDPTGYEIEVVLWKDAPSFVGV